MKTIGPKEIIEIRHEFMKQNKIPLKIYFPITRYDCREIWRSSSAVPGMIYGVEIIESLERSDMVVVYKTSEVYYYR